MADRGSRITLAVLVAALVSAGAIAQASAAPVAHGAAGNSLTATAGPVDTTSASDPIVTITGQILASGHKYGPRHCLAGRDVQATATTLAGSTRDLGDSNELTRKKGWFKISLIALKYGTADNFALVPPSGGTVTITLTVSPASAPKNRRDILRSYKCAPLSATVQVQVPPQPIY